MWYFDNKTKQWSFYDPRPVFQEANTFTDIREKDVYWVKVNRDVLSPQLQEGWNLVHGNSLIPLEAILGFQGVFIETKYIEPGKYSHRLYGKFTESSGVGTVLTDVQLCPEQPNTTESGCLSLEDIALEGNGQFIFDKTIETTDPTTKVTLTYFRLNAQRQRIEEKFVFSKDSSDDDNGSSSNGGGNGNGGNGGRPGGGGQGPP